MDSLLPVAMPPNEPETPKRRAPGWLRAGALRALIVLLPLGVGVGRAYGSLYEYPSFKEHVDRADLISIGKVSAVSPYWDHGRIMSRVTVAVEDSLKGKAQGEITLLEPGGSIGGVGMAVTGAPHFHEGDRSMLFLRNLADDPVAPHFATIDRELGKIDIRPDKDGHDTVTWARPELKRVDVVPLSVLALRVAIERRPEGTP